MSGLLDKMFATPSDQALFALGSGLLGVRKGGEGRAFMGAMSAYNEAQQEQRRNELVQLQRKQIEAMLRRQERQEKDEDAMRGLFSSPENYMSPGQPEIQGNEMDAGQPGLPPALDQQRLVQTMLRSGNPVLVQKAMELSQKKEDKETVVAPGSTVLRNGKPVFTAPAKEGALPSGIQEYLFAVQQGYKGTFEQWDTTRKRAGATNVQVGPLGRQPSPMEKKFDEKGADDLSAWALGGFADVNRQIATLRGVSKQLTDDSGLTGPLVGAQPRPALAVTNPKALQALEQVEEVIQRNLRLILGAQFTEKEGERLISRAYNPYLSPSQNKVRVDALLKQMEAAAQAKQEAYTYYQRNGTLQGWQGKMPSIEDFYNAIESAGAVGGQVNGGWKIEKAD